MNESEKLEVLKDVADVTDNDTVLKYFLSLAKEIILNRAYPFEKEPGDMPKKYESLQIEIAAYLLNKRGAEGETLHSENGISRTYENAGVPESMLKRIVPFVGTFGGDKT